MRFPHSGSHGFAFGAGEGRMGFFVAAALCLAAVLAGLVVFNAGAQGAPEDEGYSAYEDPRKAAISYILSDPANVEEFQGEFGLSDREVESVLAATRAENDVLAETYAESETILAESRSLSPIQKKKKISASSYDEEVESAIGKTKKRIEAELPEEAAANLQAWVDEQWQQEVGEADAEAARMATAARTGSGGQGMSFKVYTTQYWGYTNYEMALPHRKLKFAGGYKAIVTFDGRAAQIPIKDVGPWNTYDNYWDPIAKRTMWKNLARGIPEAQAAYFNNYNRGKDEFGREVLNPAGADLTPAAAAQLGLRKYQNAWVSVRMPWLRQ